jgi:hypothetical protein
LRISAVYQPAGWLATALPHCFATTAFSTSSFGAAVLPLQVERYKQLLLKQRDIMIALTQRLNERDEQILGLQAELEAYDTHQK